MSDPLTAWAATGAASSVVQIIGFTAELVVKTAELTKSACGNLAENKLIEQYTLRHSQLADQILDTHDPKRPLDQISEGEKAIDALARECKDASNDLLNLLKGLGLDADLKGVRRAVQSAHKAAQSLRKRQAIEIKQHYLERLNGQLSTALLLHLRRNQLSIREDVFEHINNKHTRTAALLEESKAEILEALATHLTMAKEKREYILDSLSFEGLHSRQLAIPRACQESLSWVFADASRFQRWLASPDDIFWVAGKAGSGKSTWMKHVAAHSSTRKRLRVWAGRAPIELFIAQSYMWHPGVSMQRNEQGMLQGLLFQLLRLNKQLAEFIPRWQHDFLNIKQQDPWSREEIGEALTTMFDNTDKWARYCLFIDGLDEYEGEHSKLISTVTALAKHANVKIVVSSREWNPFCNAFGELHDKIYLHEHTQKDIQTYVRQELDPLIIDIPMANDLISTIVDRAKGVFFWVFLVVRSVREGLEEGDSITIMRERVDELPSDLGQYFALILSRIPKVYRKRTYRALKLAQLTMGESAPNRIRDDLSFIRFWFLKQELLDNPRFAFDFDIQYIDKLKLAKLCSETARFLRACCKDFLHIESSQVEFLHRTVHDFLSDDQMRRSIDDNVPSHFKETLFPLHLALSRLKVVTDKSSRLWEDTLEAAAKGIGVPGGNEQKFELIHEYEKTAICYIDHSHMPDHELHSYRGWQPTANAMRHMAAFLESYQLGSFLEMVVMVDPSIIPWDDDSTSCSILQSTLGMAPYRRFPITNINWNSLQVLLQYGALDNVNEFRIWHAFLVKSMEEKDGWSPQGREYAAKVMEVLVQAGANTGGRVDVPMELPIPRCDPSYECYTPMDILEFVFTRADLESIFGSKKLSSNGRTVVQKGGERSLGAQVMFPEGLPGTQRPTRTNRPLYEPALEIPRLGRAIVVALFHAGLAGLGLE